MYFSLSIFFFASDFRKKGGGFGGSPAGGGGGYMAGGAVDSPAGGSGGPKNKDKQSILAVNVKQVYTIYVSLSRMCVFLFCFVLFIIFHSTYLIIVAQQSIWWLLLDRYHSCLRRSIPSSHLTPVYYAFGFLSRLGATRLTAESQ